MPKAAFHKKFASLRPPTPPTPLPSHSQPALLNGSVSPQAKIMNIMLLRTDILADRILPILLQKGKEMTLLMVDPDAPSKKSHRCRSWLHWMVINIPVSCLLLVLFNSVIVFCEDKFYEIFENKLFDFTMKSKLMLCFCSS